MPTETASPIPPRRTVVNPPKQSAGKSTENVTTKPPGPRKQAVLEVIGIATIPLAGMAAYQTATGPPNSISPFALDCKTVEIHSNSFADAVVDLADSYPVLGAVLDRIGTVTPFGALAATVMAVGLQIAENHGNLPPSARGISPTLINRNDMANLVVADAEKLKQKIENNGTMNNA